MFEMIIDKLSGMFRPSRHFLLSGFCVGVLFYAPPVQAAEELRPPFAIPPRLGAITDYWRPAKSTPHR